MDTTTAPAPKTEDDGGYHVWPPPRDNRYISSDQISELAKVRSCLKDGHVEEGRERLERVLDELDNCWRTLA